MFAKILKGAMSVMLFVSVISYASGADLTGTSKAVPKKSSQQ